ncbi:conserved hypothetical protein [Vibrio crassostreae]|nr:conserved hypothetical protein [Vibrio crassostreae]CAK3841353.1 conserved hypothetical protein [Vibrio crassostreae]CAK3880365.1 conserved hypothetical protein [Vibrio crassostreae]
MNISVVFVRLDFIDYFGMSIRTLDAYNKSNTANSASLFHN